MSLKIFFLFLSTILILKFTVSCKNKLKNKLNVLILIIDDMRNLEDENVFLPNINKLAGKSITFKHAYAQQALCAPSRNSFLTGRRPDSLHLYDFYSYWRNTTGNYTTLPQIFKENDYYTASVGKVFHPGASSGFTDDYPYSWSTKPYHPSTEKYKDSAVCLDPVTRKLQSNLICPVVLDNQPEHTLPDVQILESAIRILNERKSSNRPFLLAVGFHKPHIPLKYPMEYLAEKYPLSHISPPISPLKPVDLPMVAWHPWSDVRHRDDIRRLNISFPMGTMPEEYTLLIKQSYFAASTYVDDLVGQLLDHVDMQNTVVVLTSDHGWSLGENGLWAKYSNFDLALRIPLIIHSPNLQPKQIRSPVELIDLFPTLVDITGVNRNIPKCMNKATVLCFEGTSLLPLMNGSVDKSKDLAFSQYPRPGVNPGRKTDKPRLIDIKIMGYSLRTQRFRFTEWIGFNSSTFKRDWDKIYATELYDHMFDKYEARNLGNISLFKDLVKHFSLVLKRKFNK